MREYSISGSVWRRKWQPNPVFLLEKSMDRGAWQATVHRAAKCWTRLCDCLGECVISSVLSHHSKNLKQWTSVTARLQLSFIWQAKENTFSRCQGGPTPKRRVAQFWLLFLNVFPLPPKPALCKLG